MPTLSYLTTVFSDRADQFDLSLGSLTRGSYDPNVIELLVFIDYTDHTSILSIIKKYSKRFRRVKVFGVTKKLNRVNHGATRRNFLATQASGDFIIFSEPEMYHVNDTVKLFLSHANSRSARSWICGPVYASGEMVNASGKLVDGKYMPKDFRLVTNLIGSKHMLRDRMFLKRFHLIDYRSYSTPFFCAMYNRMFFLKLKGMNQSLRVRGYDETELNERFSRAGGRIVIDKQLITIHLPHPRSLDVESQVSWNLYNSTVSFDASQRVGRITDAEYHVMYTL